VERRGEERGEREVKWKGRKWRCIEEEEVGEGRRVEGRGGREADYGKREVHGRWGEGEREVGIER
jgi:hypothetical protein